MKRIQVEMFLSDSGKKYDTAEDALRDDAISKLEVEIGKSTAIGVDYSGREVSNTVIAETVIDLGYVKALNRKKLCAAIDKVLMAQYRNYGAEEGSQVELAEAKAKLMNMLDEVSR